MTFVDLYSRYLYEISMKEEEEDEDDKDDDEDDDEEVEEILENNFKPCLPAGRFGILNSKF